MYYETYKKKGRRRKRRRGGCLGWLARKLLKLTAVLLTLAVLAAVGLYFMPVALFQIEPEYELSLTTDLPASPFNVLILGVDVLEAGSQRSDTIMIASIDRERVTLTSLQRDTLVEIPGHGTQKLNAAYNYGGPQLAMRTVNETFGLNITQYVVVDFTVVVKLVDALGGVEIDVSEGEMEHINKNVLLSAKVFAPLGYIGTELKVYGEKTHLDGLQALGYARIRKLDSDFARTGRQREVIDAMLGKLRSRMWNPSVVKEFLSEGLSGIETNLSTIELISLGEKALFSGEIRQLRLPVDGTFDDNGSSLKITDYETNKNAFRMAVYGQ